MDFDLIQGKKVDLFRNKIFILIFSYFGVEILDFYTEPATILCGGGGRGRVGGLPASARPNPPSWLIYNPELDIFHIF